MGKVIGGGLLLVLSSAIYAEPPHYSIEPISSYLGRPASVTAMNDLGHMIGMSEYSDGISQGYIFSDGQFRFFADLLGDGKTYRPIVMNDNDQVVLTDGQSFWLYDDGGLKLLNLDSTARVTAMNDSAAIVGWRIARGAVAACGSIGHIGADRYPALGPR